MSRKLSSQCLRPFLGPLSFLRLALALAVAGVGTPALAQYINVTGTATSPQLNLQIQVPVSTAASTTGATPASDALALNGNITGLNSALQITLPGVAACGSTPITFGTTEVSVTCPLFAELQSIQPGSQNTTTNTETITFNVWIIQSTSGFVQSAVAGAPIEVSVAFSLDSDTVSTSTPPPTLSTAVFVVTAAPQLNSVSGSEGSITASWTVFPDATTLPETESPGLTHPYQPTSLDVYAVDSSVVLPGQTVQLPCLMFQSGNGPPAAGTTAPVDPSDPAGCTLTMPLTAAVSGPLTDPCVTFPNSNGASQPDYLDAAAIQQTPINGVKLISAPYTDGNASVTGLVNGTNYLFFLVNEPQGTAISQCFFATPQPNFTLTELNGEGAGRIVDFRCFIATAAYGSPLHPKLRYFRKFRDQILLSNWLGKSFVHYYYKYSPPLADYIAAHPKVKSFTRGLLEIPAGLLSAVDDYY